MLIGMHAASETIARASWRGPPEAATWSARLRRLSSADTRSETVRSIRSANPATSSAS